MTNTNSDMRTSTDVPNPARRSWTRHLVTSAVAVVVTAGAYLGFLGWDQDKVADAMGNEHGPYSTWQVAAFVVVLAALAVWGGFRRQVWTIAAVTTVATTMLFSIDAANDPTNGGLWPIGAALVAFGTFLGVVVVATVTSLIRRSPSLSTCWTPASGWPSCTGPAERLAWCATSATPSRSTTYN